MVFSSIVFLFRFAPIFFLLYFLTPKQWRNVTLLLGSLFFYAYGEPVYILLMLASIVVNYFFANRIYEAKKKVIVSDHIGRGYLVVAMIFNFAMLFVFKYFAFFCETVNGVVGKDVLPIVELTLPLGISFYTFQMASYVIDVYRSKYEAQGQFWSFATYVSMFPQLIAGPIVNYSEVEAALKKRTVNFRQIEWGVSIFCIGLVYKVLLANKIASLWNDVQRVGVLGINTATAWLGSIGFSMQIFFDFFGYSLMAIGLGHIMGFSFPVNFNNPYCSKTATEFWRRWHITLGRWFREYVYIPLGGNRKGKLRMICNTFVVWALTGLWHGANWNFILWGLFFFVLLMLEKFIYYKKFNHSKVIGHIYMFFVIPFSWTIFNITDLHELLLYLGRMIGIPLKGSVNLHTMSQFWDLLGTYWWLLLICVFCSTPIPMKVLKHFHRTVWFKLALFVLTWLAIYQLAMGANNPFLYFRF